MPSELVCEDTFEAEIAFGSSSLRVRPAFACDDPDRSFLSDLSSKERECKWSLRSLNAGDVLSLPHLDPRRHPRLRPDRPAGRMRRFAHDNGLSLFFIGLFLVTIGGESVAGQRAESAERIAHGSDPVAWWAYVTSPSFGGAVTA